MTRDTRTASKSNDAVATNVDAPARSTHAPEGRPAIRELIRPIALSGLLAGRNEVRIEHNGDIYVLRVTRNGKLILTK